MYETNEIERQQHTVLESFPGSISEAIRKALSKNKAFFVNSFSELPPSLLGMYAVTF